MSIPVESAGSERLADWALTRVPHETDSFSKGFSSSSSQQLEHAPSGAGRFRVGQVLLSNCESFSGTLFGNLPEGSGKYVWSDGCTYDGEWRRGMRHGVGKIEWPSGSIYEGEFSGNFIDGVGTYTGSDGIKYRGHWKLNVKHGLGNQSFPNGDTFDGSWIQGEIEGHGRYTWANGNAFVGHMKRGKMFGKGILTWRNGDTYEGNWLNGKMHGFGIYTWNNGGCYIGMWTSGLKDGEGALYPCRNKLPAIQELYLSAFRRKGLLPDRKQLSHGSRVRHSSIDLGDAKVNRIQCSDQYKGHPKRNFMKIKDPRDQHISLERHWSLEASIEKAIRHGGSKKDEEFTPGHEGKSCGTNAPILQREYVQGVLINELVVDGFLSSASLSSKRMKRHQKRLAKDIKRPGETIIKGHRSYDLMISLQLGIRYTVGKITPIQRREISASDFGPRASFWMTFPKQGSQLTPSHGAEDFKWKDYCPMVFRNLREMFKIDAADYMISICGNEALRELSSPGKSGSVFFLSEDDRFMIKTLRRSEVKALLEMLPAYHHHVRTYENTLITKFFGLHRIKPSSGQKFRFVVMGNMFCTELRIHRRFDLKGSSLGRSSNKVEIDENTILKDLDLKCNFYLEPSWRDELLKQIEIDCKFLEDQKIMDYSLLLGVHYRAPQYLQSRPPLSQSTTEELTVVTEDFQDEEIPYPQSLVLVPRGTDVNKVVMGPHIRGSSLRASSVGDEEVDLLLPGTTARLQIQLGVNMPARAEHNQSDDGETALFHEVRDVVLYVGIIDILQEYNLGKKIEHTYKSLQFDSRSISAVDPTFYSQRFLNFIRKAFPDNTLLTRNKP